MGEQGEAKEHGQGEEPGALRSDEHARVEAREHELGPDRPRAKNAATATSAATTRSLSAVGAWSATTGSVGKSSAPKPA